MRNHVYLTFSLVCATIALSAPHDNPWMDSSDSNFMSKLYTTYDNCIIHSIFDNNNHSGSGKESCPIPTNDADKRCSAFGAYQDLTTKRDQKIMSIPTSMKRTIPNLPVNFPHIMRISDLLIRLNQSNRALVLMGDSITRNSIEALMCILHLELSPSVVKISPPLEKILYNGIHYKISIPSDPQNQTPNSVWTINLVYFSIWHSFQPGRGGTTTSFHGELYRYIFNKKYPGTGALIVFNIGMHERGQHMMTKNLNEMFSFARDVLAPTPERNVTFLYRESSVQHYDEPAGMYNRNKAKKWHTGDLPTPTCRPWSVNDTDAQDWRFRAEQSALKTSHFKFKRIIKFREFSKYFWDVHAASPFFKTIARRFLSRKRHAGGDEDCTHFPPPAAPLLYRLLWHQILMH